MMTIDFLLRIVCGGLLGGLIGLEREYRAKEAGFRTHFLVALGSTLFMLVSQYGFSDVLSAAGIGLDPSRVAAQVVSGIGFIGAGTIIFQRNVVRGLTTAAGLWATAAIGLTIGGGLWWLGVVATVLVLIGLELTHFLTVRIGRRSWHVRFSSSSSDAVALVMTRLREHGAEVESYHMTRHGNDATPTFVVEMDLEVRRNRYRDGLPSLMADMEGVVVELVE
ncbi:MAG: MgtC/SapB family protein [Bacteroidaceae bacterium]|nr:MgtC/SapB family protein [Bacteroidaceae bacterium]